MTTIAEFKKMLQEEINEPLDYPRVPGLSAKELREYNEGYQSACQLVLEEEEGTTDDDWVTINLDWLKDMVLNYSGNAPRTRGRLAAYTWALEELKGLEGETRRTCSCGKFTVPEYLTAPHGAKWYINYQSESETHRYPQPCYTGSEPDKRREWFPLRSEPGHGVTLYAEAKPDPESVTIPRARYNYLLDLERSVSEFTESFTRWEA